MLKFINPDEKVGVSFCRFTFYLYLCGMKKNKADTECTLHEIEVALAKTDTFNFVRNIVAFNVNGLSELFPLHHEADMLVMSRTGYLTEIEIKRSWSDFLADFKKKCRQTVTN